MMEFRSNMMCRRANAARRVNHPRGAGILGSALDHEQGEQAEPNEADLGTIQRRVAAASGF
jgi:hypothetical protein